MSPNLTHKLNLNILSQWNSLLQYNIVPLWYDKKKRIIIIDKKL